MKRLILALALAGLSLPVAASTWQLDAERSSLYFISIKKNTVAETHHFDRLSGSYAKGEAQLAIDLASVETGIDIRDKRMREMLFEVANFPEATVTMEVPEEKVAELAVGESLTLDTTATLSLHGTEKSLDTILAVTRLSDGTVQVSNVRPVVIQADDFGLARGVEKLREVAGLPSVSPAVPADFTLYFQEKE